MMLRLHTYSPGLFVCEKCLSRIPISRRPARAFPPALPGRNFMRNPPALARSIVSVRVLLFASVLLTAGCTNSLNRAIYREKPEAIQKFLAAGANVNETNDDGGTPLIYAAQFGDVALIKTLLERGALVNSVDHEGNSPLGYLVSRKDAQNDGVALLLAHGADVNVANKSRRTPLHLAVMKSTPPEAAVQQKELVAMLLAGGADANRSTYLGELPLHFAAAAGQSNEVLEQVLTATGESQAVTHAGYHALSEAARNGHHEAALFFANHGFEPQKLSPAPFPEEKGMLVLQMSYQINARAGEARGDYLFSRKECAGALASYQSSSENYDAAVTDCEKAVKTYTDALADAKAGRKSRLVSTIALNVVGTGLGLATGVGFFAAPKKVENHIDDYAEALERNQAVLTTLTQERSALALKLKSAETAAKLEKAADVVVQAAPTIGSPTEPSSAPAAP